MLEFSYSFIIIIIASSLASLVSGKLTLSSQTLIKVPKMIKTCGCIQF